MTDQTGTRERIKRVALDLFTEHGYDKTSLREIAEQLGITKAALYYHFKSKEEIVHAFVEDRMAATEELIGWVRTQPPGKATRQEFIRRYAALIGTGQSKLGRFFQDNQPALKNMVVGEKMREQLADMVNALAGPGATLADKLRAGMSVWVLHGAWFLIRDPAVTDEERAGAALEVAFELTEHERRS